jgi:hypothetical protein
MRQLRSAAGFDVGQQVELAAVVEPVVHSTERKAALRVVAAAERPGNQVRRVDQALAAD